MPRNCNRSAFANNIGKLEAFSYDGPEYDSKAEPPFSGFEVLELVLRWWRSVSYVQDLA